MKLNLKKIYPDLYSDDEYIAVDEEIAEIIRKDELQREAFRIKTLRHKAYYSIDCKNKIEKFSLHLDNVEDEFEKKELKKNLYIAMSKLTKKQQQRIYAHYFIGLSKSDIARSEGCSVSSVDESIRNGIKKLKKLLQNNT